MRSDRALYVRGLRTAAACWAEIARGTVGAAVVHAPGADIAVFPEGPERAVYNNAVLALELPADELADAVDAVEAVYAEAGVTRFALWVHEDDGAARRHLMRRAYSLTETTRAMGMALEEIRLPRPDLELAPADWSEYLRILGLSPGLLAGVEPGAFHVLIARLDGESAATGMAFDWDGDCGVYNVTTIESARRRGLGTALTALHMLDAAARGCTTATLQSTPMAERVYAAAGFRDLGRILEFSPRAGTPHVHRSRVCAMRR